MAQTETTKRHKPSINGHSAYRPQTVWITKPTEIENMTAQKVKIPARPAKTKPLPEDHSTPYKPQAVPAPVLTLPPALPVEKPARKERKAAQWVDLSALEICDSPLSVARARPVSKYEDVLRRMKPGQCIKCQPAEVGPVASGLRSYFDRNGIVAKIMTILRYETDGLGRVWWVQAGGVQ